VIRLARFAFAIGFVACSGTTRTGGGSAPSPAPSTSAAAKPVATASAPLAREPTSCAPIAVKLPELLRADFDPPIPELVDFSGNDQMAPVYEKLARILRGKADDHLRISMYGDSNLTRDVVSGELRRTLQLAFGDGGHGYIAVGKPWSWYIHTDVRHAADDGWNVYSMTTHQVADHMYGFGGLAAYPLRAGSRAWFETADESSPVGRSVSRVEVMYLRQPGYGHFSVEVDGEKKAEIDSASKQISAGIERVEFSDAAHKIELVNGRGVVRLLGVVLERSKPGVVLDSIGIGGVNVNLLMRGDKKIARETLATRKHDLVILLTGATEPDLPRHAEATKEFIAFQRQVLPSSTFFLMGPADLAEGTIEHPVKSIRINQVDKQKRRIAEEEKTMYWDFRSAMGGELSIVHFAERKMAWSDFIHFTERGARFMGRRIGYALIRDFKRYLEKHPNAGCS
jgi:hypothetical protein